MNDDDLTIPDFLDRKKNGITTDPLPGYHPPRKANGILWPRKQINKALRDKKKRRQEMLKEKRKKLAAQWQG